VNFNDIILYISAQPWSAALPFGALVLVDWGVGSFKAWRAGTFAKESVFDWVKTTVGYSKAVAIVGSVALAYFAQGKVGAYAVLVPLVAVNGAAFLVVLSDLKDKFFPPKAAAKTGKK
jgi:hypothetical protein